MLPLNLRCALYFWLKSIGACYRAALVFEDDPDFSDNDLYWIIDEEASPLVSAVVGYALRYLAGKDVLDFLADVLLDLADSWAFKQCWTTREHYNALRWAWAEMPSGLYRDNDLPF